MKLCPDCLARYPNDQVRCAQHGRLLDVSDHHAQDDARVGTLIDGRYVLLARLGEGAMGVVYRAWQRSTAREIALKILPIQADLQAENPREYAEVRARFRREVQLAARIDSAFVARVHDSGELPDGGLYFAMELVAGTPLDKVLIAERRLGAMRVLRLARELGTALGEVHSLGLVHRDVKPGNLMVVKHPKGGEALKLVDFGIARAFEVDLQMGRAALTNLTIAGTLIGSFAYMAPEQLAPTGTTGARKVGPATDVYAAGVTLFELVTGELPYPGPTAPAFAFQHQSAPIPSVVAALGGDDGDMALVELDRILARALAKSPADRYPDGAALASAILEAERRISSIPTDRVGLFPKRRARDEALVEVAPSLAGSPNGTNDPAPPDEDDGALPPRSSLTPPSLDPGTLRGISIDDVRARAASGTLDLRRPRFSKGRVAFALAIALGLTTVVWDIVGTLPR